MLRRRLLVRNMARRIAFAALAAIVLLVGLALFNLALFLYLRPQLGVLGAVLVVALGHAVGGAILLSLAMREPRAAEIEALADAEGMALEAANSDKPDALLALATFERKIGEFRSGFSLGLSAVGALKELLDAARSEAKDNVAQPGPARGG